MGGWADGPKRTEQTEQAPLTAPPGLRRLKLTYSALRKWWYTSLWSVMGRMWVAETWRLLLKDLMVPRIQTYLSCLRCVSEEGGGQTKWRRSQKELR
jgi:hypothetical protein